MTIMSARMHPAFVGAAVFAAGLLVDRQRDHVLPETLLGDEGLCRIDQLVVEAGHDHSFLDPARGQCIELAVEQGGNVEGAVAGEIVVRHGVKIVGHRNVPSRLAADASALFARNLYNFLSAYWDKDAGRPVLPPEDEVTQGIVLTRGGAVVHPKLTGAA